MLCSRHWALRKIWTRESSVTIIMQKSRKISPVNNHWKLWTGLRWLRKTGSLNRCMVVTETPWEPHLSEKGLAYEPTGIFTSLSQCSQHHMLTSSRLLVLIKSSKAPKCSQIWVRNIYIFSVFILNTFLNWKINECLNKWKIEKKPQTHHEIQEWMQDISYLYFIHWALVKSKSMFSPVSRCIGIKFINFLLITVQHWRDSKTVSWMPLVPTLTSNCKTHEESQCPRSLGLETGYV